MSPGRLSSTRLMTCVTGSLLLVCKASSRLQVGRGFTLWRICNREPPGTKLRRLLKRLRKQWPRKGQTVMSPQWRSGHAALAFLLTICATTAAPPRSQPIRRVHCRGHRFRYPSIGRNFHPDSVQTTSLSETYCTGFHLSNEILGRAFSRFVSGCRNCGNVHRTRNEAEAAIPWGHSCEFESLTRNRAGASVATALSAAAQSLGGNSHPTAASYPFWHVHGSRGQCGRGSCAGMVGVIALSTRLARANNSRAIPSGPKECRTPS